MHIQPRTTGETGASMANSPATTAPPLSAAAIALNRFGLGARADEAPPANAKN
ncbi:conserved hypothetical protein, partial [Ricinus communis]